MRLYRLIALIGLLVATGAGASLRFGLAFGLPVWVHDFLAWRHAHSHLMYFGWGTLGLMACIWRLLPRYTGRDLGRGVQVQMALTAVFALLSFPAFLPNGYGLTVVGSLRLPLGSMVSGVNALLWIIFALLYWRATAGIEMRPLPLRLWDWAILLLMVACGGAVGFVILVMQGSPQLVLRQTLLHLFLELMALGWFTLALLGVLWAQYEKADMLAQKMPVTSLALCLAPTFFLGVSPVLVPDFVFWISAVMNVGAAILIGVHLRGFWRLRARLPLSVRFGLLCLGMYGMVAFTLLWPGLWQWAANTPLRVFYLHLLLLGWLSSGLLGGVAEPGRKWRHRARSIMDSVWIASAGILLVALLMLGVPTAMRVLPAAIWLAVAAWSTVPLLGVILGWIVMGSVGLRHSGTIRQNPGPIEGPVAKPS